VHHDITPVFHVADQPRVLDDCWYTDDDEDFRSSRLCSYGAAGPGVSDLILNGVFERHPGLRDRRRRVELDLGAAVPVDDRRRDDFTAKLNGKSLIDLPKRPSEYFSNGCGCRRSLTRTCGGSQRAAATSSCCAATSRTRREPPIRSRPTRKRDAHRASTGLFHANIEALIS
jgi:hypothetical protein